MLFSIKRQLCDFYILGTNVCAAFFLNIKSLFSNTFLFANTNTYMPDKFYPSDWTTPREFNQDEIVNELGESRFYSTDATRCFRLLNLPIDVSHPLQHVDRLREDLMRGLGDHKGSDSKECVFDVKECDPRFISWLDGLGLKIWVPRLFVNKPYYMYKVHVDRMERADESVALNFAFEDAGTIFSWYNLKKDGILARKLNGTGIPVYYFSPMDCEKVFSVEIKHKVNQPMLLNVGSLHTAQAGKDRRYCFSYLLSLKNKGKSKYPALQWREAISLFSSYIEV